MGGNSDLNSYPGVSRLIDRHGKTRWRFRRAGKTIYLPGEPFTDEFDIAYQAVLAGQPLPPRGAPKPQAQIVRLATAVHPRSIAAAWQVYQKTSLTWRACIPSTRARQTAIADEFLNEPLAEGESDTWGSMPIADLKRRHIKMILGAMSDRPFAARSRLNVIKKMIEAAIDEEWIEADPTHKLKYAPERIKGWRAWTDEERVRFERCFPIGTTARLIYEVAFWLGNRRADVVSLRWDQRGTWTDSDGRAHDVFRITQGKTGKPMVLPISGPLADVLAKTPKVGPTVVVTQYGKPYSTKSLTGRMRQWTKKAGLPQGCTIHGLRKTLGRVMTENDATTRQAMEMLGHSNIQHVELYSREASQARLATQAMEKVVAFESRRKRGG